MKLMVTLRFYLPILFVLSLTQCTIQKRTVNKGYFIQWYFNKKSDSKSIVNEIDEDVMKLESLGKIGDTFNLEVKTADYQDNQNEPLFITDNIHEQTIEKKNFELNIEKHSLKKNSVQHVKKISKLEKENKAQKRQKFFWALLISVLSLTLGIILLKNTVYIISLSTVLGGLFFIFGFLASIMTLIFLIDFLVFLTKPKKEEKKEFIKTEKPINKLVLFLIITSMLLFFACFVFTRLGFTSILSTIFLGLGIALIILAILFSKKKTKA